MKRNKIYLIDENTNERIPILACSSDCKMCKFWRENNKTAFLYFYPVHCYLCEKAGYPEDFNVINKSILLCNFCKKNNYERGIKHYIKNKSLYNFKVKYV